MQILFRAFRTAGRSEFFLSGMGEQHKKERETLAGRPVRLMPAEHRKGRTYGHDGTEEERPMSDLAVQVQIYRSLLLRDRCTQGAPNEESL